MNLPDSLRAALIAALPEFVTDPHRLVIFVDQGRLVSRYAPGLGYQWRYRLRIEFHEFTGSPDALAVPLLLWLRDHQPGILLEMQKGDDAIGFAADILDDRSWDVVFTFDLREAVRLAPREGGGWQVQHVPEPSPDDPLLTGADPAQPLRQIWLDGRLLVE